MLSGMGRQGGYSRRSDRDIRAIIMRLELWFAEDDPVVQVTGRRADVIPVRELREEFIKAYGDILMMADGTKPISVSKSNFGMGMNQVLRERRVVRLQVDGEVCWRGLRWVWPSKAEERLDHRTRSDSDDF